MHRPPPPQIGLIEGCLPKYTFQGSRLLGSGADGQVVSAKTLQGHLVAVKLLPLDTPAKNNLFQNEVFFSRTLARVGIAIQVYDVLALPSLPGASSLREQQVTF